MKRILLTAFLILGSFQILSAQKHLKEHTLQAGDLLFQDLDCGDLCDAIEKVTEGFQQRDFSHMGIVTEDKKGNQYVIEAIGSHVQKIPVARFFERSNKVIAGRLIPEYQHLVMKACAEAEKTVGVPYDDRFLMNNDSLYCSELVYQVFLSANRGEPVFDLQPMTYKDPDTRVYFPAWVSYYQELQSAIPEGEPGINPGLISRSEKLVIIYDYQKKDPLHY
jgi:hypothetical protein